MGVKASLNQFIQAVRDPGHQITGWARVVRYQWELWRYCLRRLKENNLMALSAALSFRTIFALIPLLIFALLVLKSIGVVEDSKQSLRQFLDVSGFNRIATVAKESPQSDEMPLVWKYAPMPANYRADTAPEGTIQDAADDAAAKTQERIYNVADEIEALLTQVESKLTFGRIGPIGGALLIWTAIALLSTIEAALNRIFGATRSRAMGRRIVLYWSALTLGPVVLVLASYLGEKIVETFVDVPVIRWLLVPAGWFGPIVVGVLVIATVYKLLPNTRVHSRSALVGALVAVPLWLIARWGFAQYVQHLTGSLYGVLGLLPLFLLWLNLSWTIFLFGALLAYTATNLERFKLAEQAEKIELGPSDIVAAAAIVARHFGRGDGPTPFEDISAGINLPGALTRSVIERLVQAGVLCPVGEANGEEPDYTLAAPADHITVAQLLAAGDPRQPEQIGTTDGELRDMLSEVRTRCTSSLGERTLADLITK
ncbi:MAG TPA: YhjD/YihY/BrkB family envelope integrity protein [Phycisphaerae bacterium]|nr:YihY family inner membrane protein [Phycisphaerales bacterium]HRX85457.1 YhjD/YihY/BrkB family envelope integrity protein [Phycisphaerae bacterium]